MGYHEQGPIFLERSDGKAVLFQVLGASPFKVFQVVGIVHHASAIGIFIVDLDFHDFSKIHGGELRQRRLVHLGQFHHDVVELAKPLSFNRLEPMAQNPLLGGI